MPIRIALREAAVTDSADDLAILDEAERARADRKRDPAPFVTGHALVRRALGELVDRDPATLTFARRCTTCGSDQHGKPRVLDDPGWHFSLSYTGAAAIVAVAEGVEVGVDIEDLTDADVHGFTAATLAVDEVSGFDGLTGHDLLVARARVWARKEAVLKATGRGLVVDPAEVLVAGPADPAALVAWRAEEPGPAEITIADVDLTTGDHRAAVAALTTQPLELYAL